MAEENRWQDYAIRDFTSGLIDIMDDNIIPEGAARACQNVISRTIGRLSQRRGYRRTTRTAAFGGPVQGMYPHHNSVGEHNVIVAAGGKTYRYDGTSFWLLTPVGESDYSLDTWVEYAHGIIEGNDSIVGFNGVDLPIKWDGGNMNPTENLKNYYLIQNEVPTTVDYKTYQAVHGNWKNGSVIVTANGEVLDPTADGFTIDLVNGRAVFAAARINTVPVVAKEQTVAWLNYTKFTTEHAFKPGAVPGDIQVFDRNNEQISATSYIIDIDDAGLGRGAIIFPSTQSHRAPLFVAYQWIDDIKVDYRYEVTDEAATNEMKSMRYPAIHENRIYVTSSLADKRSQIWWSEPGEPEYWPPINYWEVKPGDGDEVVKLISFWGTLIIFKRRSIHQFKGSSFDDFRMEEIDSKVGCVGPRAATVDNNVIYMVSEQGLMRFNGLRNVNLTEKRIPSFWGKVNLTAIHRATIEKWNNLVLAALPINGATENNVVLVFDTNTEAFWLWTNMPISQYCTFIGSEGKRLLASHFSKMFLFQHDVGYIDDAGTTDTARDEIPAIDAIDIQSYWEGTAFDMGSAERIKKSKKLFIEDSPDGFVPARFFLSVDYGAFQELDMRGRQEMMRMYYIPQPLRRFRYFIPRIEHTGSGPFELRGIMYQFKPKRKPKVRRSDADYDGIIPPDDFVLPWGDITIPINPQIREILPYPEVDLDVDFVRVFYTTAEDEAKIAPTLSEFKVDFINVYSETVVREAGTIAPSLGLSISYSLWL